MTIRYKCPECASVLKIKDDLAGTHARCPKCKTPFVVPVMFSDGDSTYDSRELPLDASGSRDAIPALNNEKEWKESEPSPETAGKSDSEAVLTGAGSIPLAVPLNDGNDERLHDSNDDLNVVNEYGEGQATESAVVETYSTANQTVPPTTTPAVFEDLDCPPMLLLSILPAAKPVAVAAPVDQGGKFKLPPIQMLKSDSSYNIVLPKPAKEPMDPFPAVSHERQGNHIEMSGVVDRESSLERPRSPSRNGDRTSAGRPPVDPPSDFALPIDADDDFVSRPSPRPINRPTPAAPATRNVPEKVDLATAAKMMKKAIKESQTAEASQRERDAKAGFDFAQFFREVGWQGLAILFGGVLLTYGLYLGADRMFGNALRLPKLGYVHGTVKLDGKPLPGAVVYFAPTKTEMEGTKKEQIRTSVGTADAEGQFRMMYIPSDRIEGVAVGTCRVWVTHMGDKGKSLVPLEWSEAARQVKDVTEGRQNAPFEINMTSRSR